MSGSPSYELPRPDRFTAGTVGEPGARAFFLQARADGTIVSFKVEKQQVGALAEHLAGMLSDLPTPGEADIAGTDVDFVAPPAAEWIVGRMGVAWDEGDDRLVLQCEELVVVDGEPDDVDPEELDPAIARFRLTRAQVAAFVDVVRELVAAGRPPCYLCGGPMDPAGHACPRLN